MDGRLRDDWDGSQRRSFRATGFCCRISLRTVLDATPAARDRSRSLRWGRTLLGCARGTGRRAVTAVEGDKASQQRFAGKRCGVSGGDHAVVGAVSRTSSIAAARAGDAIIVDPPRTGISREAMDAIAAHRADAHRLRVMRSADHGARCASTPRCRLSAHSLGDSICFRTRRTWRVLGSSIECYEVQLVHGSTRCHGCQSFQLRRWCHSRVPGVPRRSGCRTGASDRRRMLSASPRAGLADPAPRIPAPRMAPWTQLGLISDSSRSARGGDKCVEQRLEFSCAPEVLGMPLHPDTERRVWRFDALDHAVRGGGGGRRARCPSFPTD